MTIHYKRKNQQKPLEGYKVHLHLDLCALYPHLLSACYINQLPSFETKEENHKKFPWPVFLNFYLFIYLIYFLLGHIPAQKRRLHHQCIFLGI